jgi:hypothetical protein
MNDSIISGSTDPLLTEGLNGERPLQQGDSIVVVRDTLLAAAMVAAGVPLRKDPPYVFVRLASGAEQWSFNFHTADPEQHVKAKDCIEGWQKYLDWIKTNPNHPFAFAMCAVKNFVAFREHQQNAKPYHAYRMPDEDAEDGSLPPTLLVMAGSRKEQMAIEKGYQRI